MREIGRLFTVIREVKQCGVGIMLTGLTMMNLARYFQDVIKGAVLIQSLAISFYLGKQRR